MNFENSGLQKNEVIEKLTMELEILNSGGYAQASEPPHWAPRIFRDSVSCPNVGVDPEIAPCTSCFLAEFVPPQHRGHDLACHYIPLNESGDTVNSLSKEGLGQVHAALRSWLEKNIVKLEEETICGEPTHSQQKLLSSDRRPCLLLP